jgi:hypothetical protein
MSSGQMLSGQMSFWANDFLGKCGLDKCPSGQTSYGQMSLGKCKSDTKAFGRLLCSRPMAKKFVKNIPVKKKKIKTISGQNMCLEF